MDISDDRKKSHIFICPWVPQKSGTLPGAKVEKIVPQEESWPSRAPLQQAAERKHACACGELSTLENSPQQPPDTENPLTRACRLPAFVSQP